MFVKIKEPSCGSVVTLQTGIALRGPDAPRQFFFKLYLVENNF